MSEYQDLHEGTLSWHLNCLSSPRSGSVDRNREFFNRMDSLKQSARKKFSRLRKAISLEKLDRSGDTSDSEGGFQSPPPSAENTPRDQQQRGGFRKSASLRSFSGAFGSSRKKERRGRGGESGSDTGSVSDKLR